MVDDKIVVRYTIRKGMKGVMVSERQDEYGDVFLVSASLLLLREYWLCQEYSIS